MRTAQQVLDGENQYHYIMMWDPKIRLLGSFHVIARKGSPNGVWDALATALEARHYICTCHDVLRITSFVGICGMGQS